MVDLAGRQRTLSERYANEAFLLYEGQGSEEELTAAGELLQRSQETLHAGGHRPERSGVGEGGELPPADDEEVLSSLGRQAGLLERVLAAGVEVARTGSPEAGATASLSALQTAVDEFQAEVDGMVKRLSTRTRGEMDGLVSRTLLLGTLTLLVAGFLSFCIARSILRPLAAVIARAQQVGRGDLAVEPLGLRSRDEVGQLAQAIDEMVGGLRTLAGQTREATSNLTATVSQLQASTREQSGAASRLSSTVQQITSTVQEITQSGAQIGDRAKSVAASAEESYRVTEAGRQAALETNRTMDSIREQVESLAERIVALSEKTQTIGEIISAVNEMAEQSNLLALNATIESASAGEHGSRFSVVASEMKKLADQAKSSTVQVRTILGEIQRGIHTSVMLTEETVKRVEAGKTKADTAEDTIARMSEMTCQSIEAFQQIVGGTNQQAVGIEQTFRAMEEVRRATEQSAVGTAQLEEATATLNSLSAQLDSSVQSYRL